jgi:DNA-binding transcriptional LysR family regulator
VLAVRSSGAGRTRSASRTCIAGAQLHNRGVEPGCGGLALNQHVNLRQIEAFRAVMITGSTLRAASLLRLSQPAVSRLIAGLEKTAGHKLFERAHGRLRPTRQAGLLLEEVEHVFAGLDRMASRLRADQGQAAEDLRIIATTPIAHGLLPQTLARLRAEVPDLRFSVQVVVRRELRTHFDHQQFDIALSTYPLDYPEEASQLLSKVNAVCVLPRGHALAARAAVAPRDLVDEPFISMPLETSARQRIDALFHRLGLKRRHMSDAQNGIVICQLVAAGVGVSVVDPYSARSFAGQLVQRPFRPAIPYQFRVFFPLQRQRSPLAERLAVIAREVAEAMAPEMRGHRRDYAKRT